MLLLTAKNFAIFFALATTAFCVSTIVLAVQKADLVDELQDALDKLDMISTFAPNPTTASTTTTTSSSGAPPTPGPSTPTTTPSSVTPTSATPSTPLTSFPGPTTTTSTQNPNLPTLPPGLPDPEQIIYRLPTDLRPIKYRLYWHPNLETKICEGTVSIQVEVDKETNLIVMHAKDLEIEGISILNMMGRMRIRIKDYYLRPERELLLIELDELLYTSTPYTISISFTSKLDGLAGMYASSYLGVDGKEK